VVDTSVVVSGLLTRDASAPTARVLHGMLAGSLHFLLSVELLAEYRIVMLRPRIRERHGLDVEDIDRLLLELAARGAVRQPVRSRVRAPDAGDQHLWDLLAAEPGAILVTGDHALLGSRSRRRTVLSPAELVRRFAS
jgi:putative PIN family toxin of toxin-antitoxin system